jgi:PD-(D/E)XK nuclease superfamily
MSTRLSYSQVRLYSECGQKYKYYYIDKLREKVKSGALFFGSAFDAATEAALKDANVDEYKIFDDKFTTQSHEGSDLYLPDSSIVVYSKYDFDHELLQEEDHAFIKAKVEELQSTPVDKNSIREFMDTCLDLKKNGRLAGNDLRIYNLCNWLSLRRKGHLMLRTNREEVLPRFSKVVGTQVKVNLTNIDGDSVIGFTDVVAHWDGSAEPIVFDYKTSSMQYEADSVLTSPQLSIYCHALGLKRAGYIVFSKQIQKNRKKVCSKCGFAPKSSLAKTCSAEIDGERCKGAWNERIDPKALVDIIIDDIPAQTDQIVIQNIDEINRAIKSNIFIRNFNSCKGTFGLCPYIKVCFKGDKSGLSEPER